MEKLAMLYRAAQFYAHNCHLAAHGDTFFQDHAELGKLYGEYEEAFDGIMERMIGLGDDPDCHKVLKDAAALANEMKCPCETEEAFATLLNFEKQFRAEIDVLIKGKPSNGTQNFLQGLADESEHRTYMLGQRVKEDESDKD